jgi:hypothetical protein
MVLTWTLKMKLEPTNIAEVEQLIFGKPASAAYPANLPLEMLKCIARDLRDCEVSMAAGVETTSFAAPFLLILHIVSGGSEGNKPPETQDFGEEAAFTWFKKYTFYIERELVGRVVGISIDNTAEMLAHFKPELSTAPWEVQS